LYNRTIFTTSSESIGSITHVNPLNAIVDKCCGLFNMLDGFHGKRTPLFLVVRRACLQSDFPFGPTVSGAAWSAAIASGTVGSGSVGTEHAGISTIKVIRIKMEIFFK